jgi:hypothetical protein
MGTSLSNAFSEKTKVSPEYPCSVPFACPCISNFEGIYPARRLKKKTLIKRALIKIFPGVGLIPEDTAWTQNYL